MKVNVEYINPFIEASQKILKDFCNIEISIGKPYLKGEFSTSDNLIVSVDLTGHVSGQVVINMNVDVACGIASNMMGTNVTELNDMAKSAIGELVNMILGNTVVIFANKGIEVSVTSPCIHTDNNLDFLNNKAQNICIPLSLKDEKEIELNILINN